MPFIFMILYLKGVMILKTLQKGTVIYDQYRIDQVIYIGGNSIIYSAKNENNLILLKEHLYNWQENKLTREGNRIITASPTWKEHNQQLAIREKENNTILNNAGYPYREELLAWIEENNTFYSIFSNQRGKSLKEYPIERIKDLYTITIALLRAVDSLHTLGYLHLDLSLGNCLVIDQNTVHLIDFASMQRKTKLDPSSLSFTRDFASPELVKACFNKDYIDQISMESDQYSIGKIMLSLLGNKLENDFVRQKGEYKKIAEKCCEPDKENRYSSLKEVIDDLEKEMYHFYSSDTQRFIEEKIRAFKAYKLTDNPYNYRNRNAYFKGRIEEKRKLKAFQNSDEAFGLMMIYGKGGAGKSALMYNYILEVSDDDFDEDYPNIIYEHWQYITIRFNELNRLNMGELFNQERNLMIIVDYVTSASIQEVIHILRKINEHCLNGVCKIRMVLLERNDYLYNEYSSQSYGLDNIKDSIGYQIHLTSLSDQYMREIIEEYGETLISYQINTIMDRLQNNNTILYALILTDMIKDEVETDPYLYAYQKEITKLEDYTNHDPSLMDALKDWLCKATLIGKISYQEGEINKINKQSRRRLVSLLSGNNDTIEGIEPDVIGEYFILQYMDEYVDDIQDYLFLLWKKDPDQLVTTLIHILQDFGEHEFNKSLFEKIDLSDPRIYHAYYRLMNYAMYEAPYTALAKEKLQNHYAWLQRGNRLIAYHGKESVIRIPDGIKKIGRVSFDGVEEIDFNEVEEIERGAFENHPTLRKVILPKVKVIQERTFYNCLLLENVEFSNDLIEIKEAAFEGTALSNVDLPSSLKRIGKLAFCNCQKMEQLFLNEGLVKIGDKAFSYTRIEREIFILPSTIQEIGYKAFEKSLKVKELYFTGKVRLSPLAFYDSHIEEIYFQEGIVNIPTGCFEYCRVKKVLLAKSIQKIASYAFYFNRLTTIECPEELEEIGAFAFDHSQDKMKISVNQKLKTIGANAFGKTDTLVFKHSMEIHLPMNPCRLVLQHGIYRLMENQLSFVIDASNYSREYEFKKSIHLENLMHYHEKKKQKKETGITFKLNDQTRKELRKEEIRNQIHTLVLDEGITRILSDEFKNCKHLEKIIWNDTIISIGVDSFNGTALREIVFPPSLRSIEDGAFANTPLEKVVLNDHLEKIGNNFKRILSDSKKEGAFENCLIKEIHFNKGLLFLGKQSFRNNKKLEKVDLSYTALTVLEDRTFEFNEKLKTVFFPDTLQEIGEACFSLCSLSKLEIPPTLKVIGENCFRYCKMDELNLENHLQLIKRNAFCKNPVEKIVFSKQIKLEGTLMEYDDQTLLQVSFIDLEFEKISQMNEYCKLHGIPYVFLENKVVVNGQNFNDLYNNLFDSDSKNSIRNIYKEIGIEKKDI